MDKQTTLNHLYNLQGLIADRKRLSVDIKTYNDQLNTYEKEYTDALNRRKEEIEGKRNDAAVLPGYTSGNEMPSLHNFVKVIPPKEVNVRKTTLGHIIVLAVSAIFVFLFLRILFLALVGQLNDPEKLGNILQFIAGIPAISGLVYGVYHLVKRPKQNAYIQQCREYENSQTEFTKKAENYEIESEGFTTRHLQDLDSYEDRYKQAVLQYVRALQTYKIDMEAYESFKATQTADYESKRRICLENLNKKQGQLDHCQEQLDAVSVLHSKHWEFVDTIIDMLETGRADSCKEALNTAIEQKAQKEHFEAMEALRQLELEEMREENRRAEEARQEQRRQDQLARDEERRHNLVMEQQQADHNRAMQKAEQDRIRAEANARRAADRAARQADSDARSRAWAQCRVCAKQSGCRNPGVPGCGAFVPRR